MSLFDYKLSQALEEHDLPFYALLMAAMRRADPMNLARLRSVFPDVWTELQARYDAPGGFLQPGWYEKARGAGRAGTVSLEEARERFQAKLAERRAKEAMRVPDPPPLHDEVFEQGIEWLDTLARE